jgi:hypothetical protein
MATGDTASDPSPRSASNEARRDPSRPAQTAKSWPAQRQQEATSSKSTATHAAEKLRKSSRQQLAETDKTLRTKVLRETTEQELEEAAREVTRDPVKLMRANYLAGMIKRASGVSGFTPWVAFVFIFWICMTLNPTVVGALGTALAAVALMQGNKKGD